MRSGRLSSLIVKDIMHRDVRRTDPDVLLADSAKKMRDLDVGCLPVWENEELIGIVTDRDIICRAIATALDPATTTVRDVMSKAVAFCFEDSSATDAAEIMRDNKVRRLPVLDHDNRLVGMLTLSDLAINSPELTCQVVRAASVQH